MGVVASLLLLSIFPLSSPPLPPLSTLLSLLFRLWFLCCVSPLSPLAPLSSLVPLSPLAPLSSLTPLSPLLLLLLQYLNSIVTHVLLCLSLLLNSLLIPLHFPLLLGDIDRLFVTIDPVLLDALLLVTTLPLIVHLTLPFIVLLSLSIAIADVIVLSLALLLLGTIVLRDPHLTTLETVVATQDLQTDVASRHIGRLIVVTPRRGRRLTSPPSVAS